MKTSTYAIFFLIAALLSAILFVFSNVAYHKKVVGTTPIEVFERGGHTWVITHSPNCKCNQ